jgi:cytochrome c553
MRWPKGVMLSFASLAMAAAILWGTGHRTGASLTRPSVSAEAGPISRGAAAFAGEDFGGISMHALESNGLPLKLTAAALVLDEQNRDPAAPISQTTLKRILKRFGFLYPAYVDNLPADVARLKTGLPLGMTFGEIAPIGGSRIEVANLGCASCHSGVTYSSNGTPQTDRAVLGMPNSSLDLEAYTQAIFFAMRKHVASDQLLAAAETLYPDMDWRERQSLRWIVLPLARQRMSELKNADRAMPFPNGAPGSTNGVAALKFALRTPLAGNGPADNGVVSIPDLGDRVWKTSLLVDGAYSVPQKLSQSVTTETSLDAKHLRSLAEIMTFFTVPSMGIHPDDARSGIKDAIDIMTFLKAYRPQFFPGNIDQQAAIRGAQIYKTTCAACHGDYASSTKEVRLTRFPNWIGDVGTDRLRQAVFDQALAKAVERTAYRKLITVTNGRGYVAPPLTGIWASAPYLHNGSVPTLSALFSPTKRAAKFQVGGHALDFTNVGINLAADGKFPSNYIPFAQPVWTDTAKAGRGNAGHRFGENLTEQEKRELIEFLKRL